MYYMYNVMWGENNCCLYRPTEIVLENNCYYYYLISILINTREHCIILNIN